MHWFPSPRTSQKLFHHRECLSQSLIFQILYTLVSAATLSYMLPLGLCLLICNKRELDLLISKVFSKA